MENPAATPPTSGDLQDAPATATAAPPAARAVKATKVYGQGPTAVVALDEIDLDVEAGRFTAIMGPSGSGKSTLMQCAAGLDRLTSGTAIIGDVDIGRLSERQLTLLRRDRVGFVFQEYALFPHLTVAENIGYGLALRGVPRADRQRRAGGGLGGVGGQRAETGGRGPGGRPGSRERARIRAWFRGSRPRKRGYGAAVLRHRRRDWSVVLRRSLRGRIRGGSAAARRLHGGSFVVGGGQRRSPHYSDILLNGERAGCSGRALL
ncbi:MAG: hypothetical protein CW348_15315 [Thermobifida sp.]|uniref:ABC transporter ATP-binding protein n=1 Tax=Thermobifida sp. TaxID=2027107 RepID=UPI00257CA46D|nr:ATP-binding cassette domain-containing protein [Thermobifida sp.]MBO2531187.1 hypothetical protein [Thermobifida sp.]